MHLKNKESDEVTREAKIHLLKIQISCRHNFFKQLSLSLNFIS